MKDAVTPALIASYKLERNLQDLGFSRPTASAVVLCDAVRDLLAERDQLLEILAEIACELCSSSSDKPRIWPSQDRMKRLTNCLEKAVGCPTEADIERAERVLRGK